MSTVAARALPCTAIRKAARIALKETTWFLEMISGEVPAAPSSGPFTAHALRAGSSCATGRPFAFRDRRDNPDEYHRHLYWRARVV